MKLHWPWKREAEDTSDEARTELKTLGQRDEEVARLGEKLRETQERNNFSKMVGDAIARRERRRGEA
jgi:hypothetical protein